MVREKAHELRHLSFRFLIVSLLLQLGDTCCIDQRLEGWEIKQPSFVQMPHDLPQEIKRRFISREMLPSASIVSFIENIPRLQVTPTYGLFVARPLDPNICCVQVFVVRSRTILRLLRVQKTEFQQMRRVNGRSVQLNSCRAALSFFSL